MMSKLINIVAAIAIMCPLSMTAQAPTRWHNEQADTATVTAILSDAASRKFASPGERTAYIAGMFKGRPYVAHTLEGDEERLTVNLDELDCTTFVDVVLALSYTVAERRLGWQDFEYNLRRMRYRNGNIDGYASRLHYNCDWAMDNIHRGNIIDATTLSPKCTYIIRSIDYMSQHRDAYPALADSATFARLTEIENGYRNHRFPYIKVNDLGSRDVLGRLREGDVVAFVSKLKDLDVTHLGFLIKVDGQFHVLHASSTGGKVEVSDAPLEDFVKRNRHWAGIRVYRLKD